MVFPGRTFHSLASLSTEVLILSCSGLTKRKLAELVRTQWSSTQGLDTRIDGRQFRRGLLRNVARAKRLGERVYNTAAMPLSTRRASKSRAVTE
ncbi:uncharacterized protein LOC143897770 isoform X1 [Temnothorax americanus]|uniref:uncharacterized protein LOC143897770 isoform X1 n=1 Tax=Temnothorax americanus TaxID=1964332 RepID=UPI004068DD18